MHPSPFSFGRKMPVRPGSPAQGHRETIENEPGLYRHSEISGDGYKVFELTSLLPRTGFDLHIAKMAV